ncbi:hypothetical protein L3Q82_018039, partial [Scortum barcoo]
MLQWSSSVVNVWNCASLTSEPTHLHHQAHTQLAQDPVTGHTLVISTMPVTHTPLI